MLALNCNDINIKLFYGHGSISMQIINIFYVSFSCIPKWAIDVRPLKDL